MLCGPKVVRLLPFLQQKGFNAEAWPKGSEALAGLRAAPCHLLLLELELGDLMAVELAKTAKDENLAGACLLVDDGMKAGMIVSAMARGIDSFVSIPPDERVFFDRIESMLLAQWGQAVQSQQQSLVEEVGTSRQRIEDLRAEVVVANKAREAAVDGKDKELATIRKRVAELEGETKMLRDQLATMHLVMGAKSGLSDEGIAEEELDSLIDMSGEQADDEEDFFIPETNSGTVDDDAAAAAAVGAEVDAEFGDGGADFLDDFPAGPPTKSGEDDAFDDAFDERTQAIPQDLAKSLLAGEAASLVTRPALGKATLPDPARDDDDASPLADFDVGGIGGDFRNETDGATAAMPADLARSLLANNSAALDALEDMDAPTVGNLRTPAGAGFLDDFDAPTMAIPRDVAAALIKERRAPTIDEASPPGPPPFAADGKNDDGSSFEDEKTPIAGTGRAPPVPAGVSFAANEEATAPGGFDVGIAPGATPPAKQKTSPHLDSQLMRDLSGIPSAADDEVLFVEDEK